MEDNWQSHVAKNFEAVIERNRDQIHKLQTTGDELTKEVSRKAQELIANEKHTNELELDNADMKRQLEEKRRGDKTMEEYNRLYTELMEENDRLKEHMQEVVLAQEEKWGSFDVAYEALKNNYDQTKEEMNALIGENSELRTKNENLTTDL